MLGTVFPVGFRAAETSRVMRVEPHDYHAIAAVAPDLGKEVGKLAANRMGGSRGLQGIAAEPPPPRAIVVGHRWDAVLRGAAALPRPQPDHVQVAHARRAGCRRDGAGRCRPTRTARRSASSTARPWCGRSCAAWPSCWGSATDADAAEYDAVIVGAGPAGLAAAVYGASEGLRTIVIEREAPGGQAGTSSRIENYLGFPSGVSGDELASRALQQARRLGAEILVTRSITRIDAATRQVHLDGGDVLRGADDHPRLRRRVAAPGDRRIRPARRQGHLLRRGAQRGGEHARPRRAHRGRRQLGRAGGDVLLHPRAERDHPLPRRDAREEHVALPHRPARGPVRTSARCIGRRSSRPTATSRSRRSRSATARPGRPPGSSRAGCSSSSARTPRRRGCRRRSRSTAAATCSRAPTCAPPGAGTLERDPYLLETSVPGRLRVRRRPVRPGQARRRGGRRGQHGDRLRAPVPQAGGGRRQWRLSQVATPVVLILAEGLTSETTPFVRE